MNFEVKIRIREREPMINVTYKVHRHLKDEVEKIANQLDVTQGEVVRAFLEYALDAYKKGRVTRIWTDDSPNMKKFREELAVGDTVIASGNVGRIVEIEDLFVKIQICDGVVVTTLREGITDVIGAAQGS